VARIFITGSADGLGQMSANLLIQKGHQVVLHARNAERARQAIKKTPGAEGVLTAELSSVEETRDLAKKVNQSGQYDAIIHNAGVYQTSSKQIFAVNTLAPFILTALIQKPKRLIYLSSGMHLSGRPNLDNLKNGLERITYSDSKLHVMMLTLAVARKWPDVYANAVDPGWVPTRMGGRNAPDDLRQGYETQSWLAVSEDARAKVSGRYFYHQKERQYNAVAADVVLQDKLVTLLEEISGVSFKE
jgi:NAD(P)-dependent dehydrogenase (short-subunit alcohol dehydrogenase family)